ncbi:MAG: ATP-binding cassette domain-containing protein [Treponema sp.]|nr:ATP-binding cassette domain-containing protein [Treponema sp.]
MSELALEVNDLVKYFPVTGKRRSFVKAVDKVSLKIEKGQTLGLVGESGCGKSTVARTISRIYRPMAGEVRLFGTEISQMNERQLKPYRRSMQMIFQDPYSSLNGRMTIKSILEEPLIAHDVKGDRIEMICEMLERVGLEREHIGRYPHEFSGGQRQRICIARALILEPEFIICDEPISALDVSIQAQVVNLLKKFQKERGLTYLFIAHDLSMIRYISDNVGVMYLGKMVEFSNSREIYRNPLHPYTKGLLASVPIPDPKLARAREQVIIEGDIPSPIDPPPGCRFAKRCNSVLPRCTERDPEYKEVEEGHFCACHLF